MLRKRLLAGVIVRHGWAVQSFGYRRWLPLGKVKCVVENLDRWGADGIIVIAIDRADQGPDLELIERLGAMGLSTPLTYGGGLATEEHARNAIQAGAERLLLDSVLILNPQSLSAMSSAVGVQALVAALPLIQTGDGNVSHYNHLTGTYGSLAMPIKDLIGSEQVSEVLVIDVAAEGKCLGYNMALLDEVESHTELPLLAFGGMSSAEQIRPVLSRSQLAGVVVGNSLNYREHSIFHLKSNLTDQPLRLHSRHLYV